MGEIDECLYEGAVRAGSVNRRSTRVKVRMKVHHRASLVTSFPTLRPCGGPMGYDGWWTGLLEACQWWIGPLVPDI